MIAVLFSYQPSTGETLSQVIDWGDNPIKLAEGLKASIFDDFPGAIWSIAGDDEAREAVGKSRMKEMLGADWEPSDA